MKYAKVVGFGDSWVWGDELLDPELVNHPHAHPVLVENTAYREQHCFVGRVAQHYGVPCENFGIPGGSLQSTIWNYLWWIEHETVPLDQCLVLVGLTDGGRTSFYNPNHVSYSNDPPWNRYVHSAWIHSGSCYSQEWQTMAKQHVVLTDCRALAQLNYQQAVLFFHGQSCSLTPNLFQFCTIDAPMVLNHSSLLWPNQTLSSLLSQQPDPKSLLAPQRHPNENGHSLIAQHLISAIDSCTMYEC